MAVLSSAATYGAGAGAYYLYKTFDGPIDTFLTEIAKTAGHEIGQDLAEISEKLKEVIISWLEGFIERPDEISYYQMECQNDLNKALLPQEFDKVLSITDIVKMWSMDSDIYGANDFVREIEDFIKNFEENRLNKDIAYNRDNGNRRETEFKDWLEQQYAVNDGYIIEDEVYLRDKDGNIVKDPVTGEARRVDFVVIKDGKVIKSYEVTSPTAPKEDQMAKEARIRENGGNYMRDEETGELISYDDNVKTEVVRLA